MDQEHEDYADHDLPTRRQLPLWAIAVIPFLGAPLVGFAFGRLMMWLTAGGHTRWAG